MQLTTVFSFGNKLHPDNSYCSNHVRLNKTSLTNQIRQFDLNVKEVSSSYIHNIFTLNTSLFVIQTVCIFLHTFSFSLPTIRQNSNTSYQNA